MTLDEERLRRFTAWLPDIDDDRAYVVQVMLRPWKSGHEGLPRSGLLHLELVEGGCCWRERLETAVRRAALIASRSSETLVTVKGSSLVHPPPDAVAVYTRVNPSVLHRAATRLCIEHIEDLEARAYGGASGPPRLFSRLASVLARSLETRFHTLDVEDEELLRALAERLHTTLGVELGVVKTRRGGHILIPVTLLDEERARLLFRELLPEVLRRYRGLVEHKREGLEPTPGTLYKGVIVDFIVWNG